jgi:lipopolysaccharide export system permease protein
MPKEYRVRQKRLDSVRNAKDKEDSIRYKQELGEIDQEKMDSLIRVKEMKGEERAKSNADQAQNVETMPKEKARPESIRSNTINTTKSVTTPVVSKTGKIRIPPKTAADSLRERPVSEINLDSIFNVRQNQTQGLRHALSETRNIKNKLAVQTNRLRNQQLMIRKYKIEVNKKYAQAFACLVMFLIGAPLGAIIKKGGLGVPVIISIVFFILYYVMSITGKKWVEEGVVTPFMGIWGYSFFLLPVGLFFLRQAKNDARLLESDFYSVALDKLRNRFNRNQ